MPDDKTIDFVVAFISIGMLVLGLGSWLLGWLVAKWDQLVNRSQAIMSRPENDAPQNIASSLQTDTRQTPDKRPSKEQLLTLYKALRVAGVEREAIRPALKGVGVPLDNNLWAQAAPPPPPHVTPIADRPTSAQFQDPDYPYQPLN